MTEISGEWLPQFDGVQAALAASLDAGTDLGASVAVLLGGEPVVDIWGGWTDSERTRPWQRDTIVNLFSTSKTILGLCGLVLADRGELDLDAPVARYWPEFAAEGKDGILIRHVLGHTAGIAGWDDPITEEDLYDWDKVTTLLARQRPWWTPGTDAGYHTLTQGYLFGEVVRRITGVSIGTFIRDELAHPLAADYHVGVPSEALARVADLIPPPPLDFDVTPESMETMPMRVLANPVVRAETTWTTPWRRAEIPSVNGHGNARSVAALQSVLACGGQAGGQRLMTPAGCEAVFREQSRGVDLVLGVPVRRGLGYAINSADTPVGPNDRTCFWSGWGGSMVVVDLEARLVIAYVMNRMEAGIDAQGEAQIVDPRAMRIVNATYAALTRTNISH
ncbi:serine hydrolase domain-containing protein [Nocardia beijingensis]|uniref:serine hydrolase domain-containing protein n=1 Tax=Nocardia beijingensis TaxID=95162 RepID=UPI00340A14CC